MTIPVANQTYVVANSTASTGPLITFFSTRNPTTNDVNYSPTQRWFNTANGHEWILVGFTQVNSVLQAIWDPLSSSVTTESLSGNTGGSVGPDGSNNINVIGDLTSGINVTGNPATHTLTIHNTNGVPSTGFTVDAHTAPGTDPVVPNSSGLVTVTGGQVAAGTTANVIQTDSLAANAYTIQVQRSQAVASSTVGDNGVCHFNSADFTVDGNGFVSFTGTGTAETFTGNSGGAVSPTANNINTIGAGSITIVGNPGTSTLTTELTGLTEYNVLVGQGTSTIGLVAPSSTTGYVLTSNGSSSYPTFQAQTGAKGSWILLQTQNVTNVASVVFNSTYITSTYNDYFVLISSAIPATNEVGFQLNVSTNNGSSYLSSGYNTGCYFASVGGTAYLSSTSTGVLNTNSSGTNSLSNSSFGGVSGQIFLSNMTSGVSNGTYTSVLASLIQTGDFYNMNGGGNFPTATVINNIQFIMTSGNIASGIFSLYGIAS